MVLGPTRRYRSSGRFLDWKIRLFVFGAVLLLIGMVREMDMLVVVAFAILVGAFLLRFFEREPDETAEEYDDEQGEDGVEHDETAIEPGDSPPGPRQE